MGLRVKNGSHPLLNKAGFLTPSLSFFFFAGNHEQHVELRSEGKSRALGASVPEETECLLTACFQLYVFPLHTPLHCHLSLKG